MKNKDVFYRGAAGTQKGNTCPRPHGGVMVKQSVASFHQVQCPLHWPSPTGRGPLCIWHDVSKASAAQLQLTFRPFPGTPARLTGKPRLRLQAPLAQGVLGHQGQVVPWTEAAKESRERGAGPGRLLWGFTGFPEGRALPLYFIEGKCFLCSTTQNLTSGPSAQTLGSWLNHFSSLRFPHGLCIQWSTTVIPGGQDAWPGSQGPHSATGEKYMWGV